jgi:hypothetical protein
MRALAGLIALAAGPGCFYGFKSLPASRADGTAVLPGDANAEAKRRANRRWWALAGGAVELGLGALARYAFTQSSDAENRILLGMVSETLLMVGAGDVALATADSLLATPFVDEHGAFRAPIQRDDREPSSRAQVDAGAGVGYASQGRVESHYDVAVFRWLRPTLRVRYQLGFDRGAELADDEFAAIYYGAGIGASLEWNPGARRHFGRHPNSALVVSVLPRVVWGHDDPRFGWRASVGWGFGRVVLGAGGTQILGEDSAPGLEVWLTIRPFPTD